ncbi:MAG: trmU [Chloroflexi bacterium]|nr:trmU [Chloroflexota bacterium]
MSGGVDSSVAAALLIQQGYEVIGMMLRLWSETGRESDNRCCTPDAMAKARRVSAILGVPFYVVDAKQIFHETVVRYFLDGYAQGGTPNPCLICNRQIRWEFLLQHALAMEADYLATGHYVRLSQDAQKRYQIRRAVDHSKDQSYILHVLNQEKLAHARFPIGEYPKSQVRKMAEELGLPVANLPDSQDLCFLGADDYRHFLIRNIPQIVDPGPILDQNGHHLGEHQGLAFYTIGQRKGLGIASPVPLYVIKKDLRQNALIIGRQDELGMQDLIAKNLNWISGEYPSDTFRALVKIRSTAQPVWGSITPLADQSISIHFDQTLRDITPGQAAVIYDDDICLGGGIIGEPALT